MDFCQAPSQQWLSACEEWDDDPRLAEGAYVLARAALFGGGWVSPWDSRAPDLPPLKPQ